MKKSSLLLISVLVPASFNALAAGMHNDDPLLNYFKADKFEIRDSISDKDEGDLLVWEFDAWVGKDLNKFWVKYSGESLDGEVEGSEVDLLYSQALTAFWDVQYGLRHEIDPSPSQNWLGFGFMGVAPYLFEIDTNLFINQDSNINVRLDAEYEYLLTQKLVLVPILELSVYSDDDIDRGVVSGLSLAELGLRLHYEVVREFSPYIGLNYEKSFGNSVVEESSESQVVLGLSFWF